MHNIILKKHLNTYIINIIDSFLYYNDNIINKSLIKWKKNISKTNCFVFNFVNDSRFYYHNLHEVPCWYCKSGTHSIRDCVKYHSELHNLRYKLKNIKKLFLI